MKKTVCLLLSLILLCGVFSGCEAQKESAENHNYPTQLPNYDSYAESRQLEIMAFWSPPINEKQYTWMKECGITAVLVDNKYQSYTGTNRKRLLNMCQELDIDVYFPLDRNSNADVVKNFEEWKDYPAFKGFYCDEPITKQHIDNIASQYEAMNELNPNLTFIGNLCGNYSEDPHYYSWIYPTEEEFLAEVEAGQFFANYDEYVQYYIDTVIKDNKNIRVSATNYPLLAYDMGYESTLTENWLRTLGKSKKSAQNAGIDMWQFIATTAYHNGGNVNYHRQPTAADIRWQSYMVLAFGGTGIEEFVYMTVGQGGEFTAEDHGPIWWKDQNDHSSYYRTDTYYYAQEVHQELTKFDHVLLSFDWKGVLINQVTEDTDTAACMEKAVGVLSSCERIKNVESSRDLLIGCFEDENNYDGFLIVNFDDTLPYNQLKNQVSVEFAHAKQAMVYVKGEPQVVDLENNTYTCTLLPGEAVFVIPVA